MPPLNIILKRFGLSLLAGLILGALLSEASFYFLRSGETRPPQVVVLTIPPGTADRVAQGESDPTIPNNMIFVVGDTLLVNNHDSVSHNLGPLYIPAGSSASMNLNVAQEYAFACSFTPSKYIGLSVNSPLDASTRLFGILEAGIPMGLLLGLYTIIGIPWKPKADQK